MKWTFWTRTQPITPDDCGTIEPLLSLYADGMASAEEARRVETHLPDCPDCRASLAWMQATQRALAARPIVAPPADLRARIASAIAASSAVPVPVSFDVRRVYALRSAYAASASLAVLGFVSYSMLHYPHPQVAALSMKPPVAVATGQPVNSSSPGIKPVLNLGVKTHLAPHLKTIPHPVRSNPDMVAQAPPDEAMPEPINAKSADKVETGPKAAPMIALPKPRLPVIRNLGLTKFKPELTAINKHPVEPVETHKAPAVKTEANKPETVVATTTQPAPPVTVNVGPPTIKQDPTPTVEVASSNTGHARTDDDLLGPVRARLGAMRSFTHNTIDRVPANGVDYAEVAVNSTKMANYDIVRGSLH